MNAKYYEWLKTVEAGTRVALANDSWATSYWIGTVERVTATQIILGYGRRYRRDRGSRVGADTWSQSRLLEVTDDVLNANRRHEAISVVQQMQWRDAPDEILFAVAKIIAESKEKQTA